VKRIPFVDLGAQWQSEREELLPIMDEFLARGHYILAEEVERFESDVSDYFGGVGCVALNSGTDALTLALFALGVGRGDEVITPPNSFIASTACVTHVGATPVFADVQQDQMLDPASVRSAITPRTKAIIVVHLTGRSAQLDELSTIASEHGIHIVEDCAQAIGSSFAERLCGLWGTVGCFSTHPLKNLAALGDGGFVVTSDASVEQRIRLLRNHGLADRNTAPEFGVVSRMDGLQAAALRFRLARLGTLIESRRLNAALYASMLDQNHVYFPIDDSRRFSTYHTFVIQVDHRDELQAHLESRGIGTAVHYPIPVHLQPAAARFGYGRGSFPEAEHQADRILSIPVHQSLAPDQIAEVAEEINSFVARYR